MRGGAGRSDDSDRRRGGISKERPESTARRDGGEAGASPSPSGASRPAEDDDNGISCPVVSCVLTVRVPGAGAGRTARRRSCATDPYRATVVEAAAAAGRRGRRTSGISAAPARMLAFEGSLLHGVVPGVPPARERRPGGSSSDVGCDCDEDGGSRIGGRSHDDDDDGGSDVEGDDDIDYHRITDALVINCILSPLLYRK